LVWFKKKHSINNGYII